MEKKSHKKIILAPHHTIEFDNKKIIFQLSLNYRRFY